MVSFNLESVEELSAKLYEAKKKELFSKILIREMVGTYPKWDFSKEAREARARRKALWEEKKQEIESEALRYVETMLQDQQIPDATRTRIMKNIQGH